MVSEIKKFVVRFDENKRTMAGEELKRFKISSNLFLMHVTAD